MSGMTPNPITPSGTAIPKMDPRLAAAIARGAVIRQKLAVDERGSISTMQAARQIGVCKTTVLRRWRDHRLVAWKQGRSVRVPVWQFAGRKMLKGIEETLQIFGSDDHWRVMLYFLGKRISLGDSRPLDLLRMGKVEAVIEHAKAYAADNTW